MKKKVVKKELSLMEKIWTFGWFYLTRILQITLLIMFLIIICIGGK